MWSKVYDFFKKDVWRAIFAGVIVILLIWGTISAIRLEYNRHLVSQYRAESEQSRAAIERLTEQQCAIEELTRSAVDYCNGNEEFIGQAVTTTRELRAQIYLLQECYNHLRDYIFSIRNYNSDYVEGE